MQAAAGLFGGRSTVAAASNFQLKGVVAADDGRDSVAILSANGKPAQAVRQGAEIVPGAVVKEVHRRYVLVSDGGVPKRVELPESAPSSARANPIGSNPPPVPVRPNPPSSQPFPAVSVGPAMPIQQSPPGAPANPAVPSDSGARSILAGVGQGFLQRAPLRLAQGRRRSSGAARRRAARLPPPPGCAVFAGAASALREIPVSAGCAGFCWP